MILRVNIAQGHTRVIVNATGCEFDSHSIHFFVQVSRSGAVLSSVRESGERSVLTVGFLYLPYYMRDTA